MDNSLFPLFFSKFVCFDGKSVPCEASPHQFNLRLQSDTADLPYQAFPMRTLLTCSMLVLAILPMLVIDLSHLILYALSYLLDESQDVLNENSRHYRFFVREVFQFSLEKSQTPKHLVKKSELSRKQTARIYLHAWDTASTKTVRQKSNMALRKERTWKSFSIKAP